MRAIVACCLISFAPAFTASGAERYSNPVKLDLRIPEAHPYLALVPEEIARAKAKASGAEWAREALAKQLAEADGYVRKGWDKLPERANTEHRSIGNRLFAGAVAYALSGERQYAEWTRDGLLAYADIYPGLPVYRKRNKLFTQSSLYESTWLVVVAQAYDLVANSAVFTAEQKKHVENDLLRPAAALFKVDDFQNDPRIRDLHFRCYNFQAWHISAVGLVGLAVKDPELVDWAVNSPYGFRHLVAHDINDDGIFWERSIGYHNFVISALLPFTDAMRHCGVDLYNMTVPGDHSRDEDSHYMTDTSSKPKSLRLMFEAPFYLAFPDLTYPALGDSDRGPLRARSAQLEAYDRYQDPKLAWLLRRGGVPTGDRPGRGPDWRWLVYDMPPAGGSSGLPIKDGVFASTGEYRNGCSLFPSTGVAVLREFGGDFTAKPEATAVSLSFGPHGGGHGHSDQLDMVLYAQGRQWLPDFGSMPYETHWKAEWTAHTVSHNTLVIDGVSQKPTGKRNVQWPGDSPSDKVIGKLVRFDPRARVASASCDRAYDGVVLARSVRLRRHCVIDEFSAVPESGSGQDRQFDYVLHVDGELAKSSVPLEPRSGPLGSMCGYQLVEQKQGSTATGVTSLTFTADGKQFRLWIAASDAAPVELILGDGLTNSPDQRMPTLVVRRKAPRARFVTVFEPVQAGNELRGVRVEPSAVVLEWTKGRDRVALQ